MLVRGLLLASLLAPAGVDPAAEPAVERRKQEYRVALLATRGIDQPALVDALGMRFPELTLKTDWEAKDGAGAPGTIFVDVQLTPTEPGGSERPVMQVDLVLADGRAFRRKLQAGPDDARVVASFIANLLLSIEEETVAADREGVPIPESSEAADLAAVVEKLDGDPTPAPPPENEEPPGVETPPQPARWAPWQLGPRLSGGVALAAGPPAFADTLAGGGGSVGLDARKDSGLLLEFDLRFVGEDKDEASMLRVRGAVGAGYEWRWAHFALPLSAAYTLEGYRIEAGEGPVSTLALGAPSLLNGLRLRLAPSARIALDRGPLRALRFGLRGEIAGSFGWDAGPHVVGIRQGLTNTGADELFRLGGLELGVGVEVGADFGIRARSDDLN